ncbi:MAG TPA: molybdenum cofactor biosynthesis protein MoaE [Candidatus Acidoferrales bacterium]|nr:molybdenum cofactor biosynthesis protein MoaE [Candidatus Acidoferrales bacterium]
MEIEFQLVHEAIAERVSPPPPGAHGAWLEFRGIVRSEEAGQKISALEYEAYPEMAKREIRRLLEEISSRHPCLAAKVIHRVGIIPVGETAIYVGLAASHRTEAIALLADFMDRLKLDVPIWKRRALPVEDKSRKNHVPLAPSVSPPGGERVAARSGEGKFPAKTSMVSLDEALAGIQSHCRLLPAVRAVFEECPGRVLRETICASEDFPDGDRSTRDGYAMLQRDESETFQVVDTLHAADWKPRELKTGETVRVATGASLPCDNLQVVMQEHIERTGDQIKILRRESATNVRRRGEEMRAGEAVLQPGVRLGAGALALLASVGCTRPLVGPRLHVCHFTTGDEIVSPDRKPRRGQIRDSNSILIRILLQKFSCDVEQARLPEDFELAKSAIRNRQSAIDNADVLLVSGGASVGDKDFTRPLLEWLGFEIVFSRVNLRPGAPLIFGIHGKSSVPANQPVGSLTPAGRIRVAFGLPGNPLSHFVCFHLFVAAALVRLTGGELPTFRRGTLVAKLEDGPNSRATLWPARLQAAGLQPLAWASSGDVTCLAETNALIHVPANSGPLAPGAEVDFLPITIE